MVTGLCIDHVVSIIRSKNYEIEIVTTSSRWYFLDMGEFVGALYAIT